MMWIWILKLCAAGFGCELNVFLPYRSCRRPFTRVHVCFGHFGVASCHVTHGCVLRHLHRPQGCRVDANCAGEQVPFVRKWNQRLQSVSDGHITERWSDELGGSLGHVSTEREYAGSLLKATSDTTPRTSLRMNAWL
jgi:hypothetical protein